MKKAAKLFCLALATTTVAGFVASSPIYAEGKPVVLATDVNDASVPKKAMIGDTGKILLQYPENAYDFMNDATYTVSDTSVLSIDQNGNWKALKSGTVTVTVQLQLLNYEPLQKEARDLGYDIPESITEIARAAKTYTVTVEAPSEPLSDDTTSPKGDTPAVPTDKKAVILPTDIDMSSLSKALMVGDSGVVSPIYPDGAYHFMNAVTYAVSDSSVLSIDEVGNWKAVAPGKVTVTIQPQLLNYEPLQKEARDLGYAIPDMIPDLAREAIVVTVEVKGVASGKVSEKPKAQVQDKAKSPTANKSTQNEKPAAKKDTKVLPHTGEQATGIVTLFGGMLMALVIVIKRYLGKNHS